MSPLPVDKVAHAGAGGAIAVIITTALTPLVGPYWAALVGFLVGSGAGLAKEAVDAHTPGNHWDWADAAATIGGAAAAAVLLLLFAFGVLRTAPKAAAAPPAAAVVVIPAVRSS